MTPVDRFGNEGSTVEFEATTLQHTNRPPTQKANFLDVEAAKAGEKYSKKFKRPITSSNRTKLSAMRLPLP